MALSVTYLFSYLLFFSSHPDLPHTLLLPPSLPPSLLAYFPLPIPLSLLSYFALPNSSFPLILLCPSQFLFSFFPLYLFPSCPALHPNHPSPSLLHSLSHSFCHPNHPSPSLLHSLFLTPSVTLTIPLPPFSTLSLSLLLSP